MKTLKYRLAGVLAVLLVAGSANSAAGGMNVDLSLAGPAWGTDVAGLRATMERLEPDLCARTDQGYFASKGWSCEGYVRHGRRLGAMTFDVHLRMAEQTFTLSAISMKASESATAGRRANLLSTCDELTARLSSELSSSPQLLRSDGGASLVRVYKWDSSTRQTSAMLVCRDLEEHQLAEVQLDMEQARAAF